MPQSIEDTLKLLCTWYDEPSIGNDRPKLLSKLALLELCGWIEETLDEIIREVDKSTINDGKWVYTEVIKKTYGFNYNSHFRPMLVKLIGEVFTRKIESEMNNSDPGDLDNLKSLLNDLWNKRGNLAHADIAGNVASQVQFDAPSWSMNQYRILKKRFSTLEKSVTKTLKNI